MQKEIIVITGAAQRVGLAVALDLQQAGYQVVASYRSMRPGLEQLQAAGIMTLQCDLTDLPSLANFISQLQNLGPLRAIIHNASDWRKDPAAQHQSLLQQLETEAASFDYLQHVHARAPYLLNRALLPQLQVVIQGPASVPKCWCRIAPLPIPVTLQLQQGPGLA